jgi:formylglycine-generating enzyme required for sulfatase activity
MKRIQGIVTVLGLVGALTVMAQEMKPGQVEVIDLDKDVKLEMVLIPAGQFIMGSPALEKWRYDDEIRHTAKITKPYYMGKYEVTQEQWEAVMGEKQGKNKGAKFPVAGVSWESCQEFIKKLNAKTNGGYRLPTESEWEYSCRIYFDRKSGKHWAFSDDPYSTGNRLTKDHANIEILGTVAVGSYSPNFIGLHDMHGNVFEWCEDWYGRYPDGFLIDPKGPAKGKFRVIRGGSFNCIASDCRSASRFTPTLTNGRNLGDEIGFRLARTADSKASTLLTPPKSDPTVITPATKGLLVAPFTEAKAKELQKEVAKSLQKEVEEKEDLGKEVKLQMILIPAGKFMMGSPVSEKGRGGDETQHEVVLTKSFYMGKYEVTQEQWEAVMRNNPSSRKGAKFPLTDVSWEDCRNFIKKLNAKTDGGYRLPTEAEWEYACRAGTSTAYYFGDSLTKSDGNYNTLTTKPVGNYKPNVFGLYDMHGNAREWCEDWYGDYPSGAATDPKGPAKGEDRVLRDGSFYLAASKARSSGRIGGSPTFRFSNNGFRLARTP